MWLEINTRANEGLHLYECPSGRIQDSTVTPASSVGVLNTLLRKWKLNLSIKHTIVHIFRPLSLFNGVRRDSNNTSEKFDFLLFKHSNCLLLVYRNAIDFYVMILHSATSQNSFISFSSFVVASLGFSIYIASCHPQIMRVSLFHFWFGFLLFLFLTIAILVLPMLC